MRTSPLRLRPVPPLETAPSALLAGRPRHPALGNALEWLVNWKHQIPQPVWGPSLPIRTRCAKAKHAANASEEQTRTRAWLRRYPARYFLRFSSTQLSFMPSAGAGLPPSAQAFHSRPHLRGSASAPSQPCPANAFPKNRPSPPHLRLAFPALNPDRFDPAREVAQMRNCDGTRRRCTVSVSSKPSPKLRAALGFKSISSR
jgi:hypothetical protein